MAQTSPERKSPEHPFEHLPGGWLPLCAAVGLGLGLGLIFTGGAAVGAGIMGTCSVIFLGGWVAAWWARRHQPADELEVSDRIELTDPETGLANVRQLEDLLKREIARSQRYGDRTALAIFEIAISGYQLEDETAPLPSPAEYVASELRKAARDSDILARIGGNRYAVLLTECDDKGAWLFCERTRTKLGTAPFGRTEEGKSLYVRAWAGVTNWRSELTTPQTYLEAAVAEMERTRPGYEQQQAWFRGTSLNA